MRLLLGDSPEVERERRLKIVGGRVKDGKYAESALHRAGRMFEWVEAAWGLRMNIEMPERGVPNTNVHTPLVVVSKEAPSRKRAGNMSAVVLGLSFRAFNYPPADTALPFNTKQDPGLAQKIRARRTDVMSAHRLAAYLYELPFDADHATGAQVVDPGLNEAAKHVSTGYARPSAIADFLVLPAGNPGNCMAQAHYHREAAAMREGQTRADLLRAASFIHRLGNQLLS